MTLWAAAPGGVDLDPAAVDDPAPGAPSAASLWTTPAHRWTKIYAVTWVGNASSTIHRPYYRHYKEFEFNK